MQTNDVDLSLIDLDNLSFSETLQYPKRLQVIDNRVLVTYNDDTQVDLGMATLPANKSISNAAVNAFGRLIITYEDSSVEDLGVIKGVREIPLTTTGTGVLTSRNEGQLNFEPLPLDPNTISLVNNVLTPAIGDLRAENYAHIIELSPLADNGYRPVTSEPYISALNHVTTDNIGLTMKGSWVQLPAGSYYVIGTVSNRKVHVFYARLFRKDVNGAVITIPQLDISTMEFASSVSGTASEIKARIDLLDGESLGLGGHMNDSRNPSLLNAGGVGSLIDSVTPYNVYSQLRIWRL